MIKPKRLTFGGWNILVGQRRFMVPITIFVDPEHTNEIAELIGQFLPYDQKKRDAVDKLSSRLRF